MAAQGISQLGLGAAQVGQQQQYVSGLLNQGLLQQGFQNRELGQKAGQAAASQWGGLFARLSSALGPVGAKKPTPPLPGWGTKLPGMPSLPSGNAGGGQGDFLLPGGIYG
jgi:hypothetical protein